MKTRSIRSRIVYALLIPTLLIGGILLFYVIIGNQQLMASLSDRSTKNRLDSFSYEIDLIVRSIELDSLSIKSYAESRVLPLYDSLDTDMQNERFQRFENYIINLSHSDETLSYFVYFQPQLQNYPIGFAVQAKKKASLESASTELEKAYFLVDTLKDHKRWYFETLTTQKPGWYGPYVKNPDGSENDDMIMTYAMPLMSGKSPIGVVGIDIRVKQLKALTNAMLYHDQGHVALLNSDFDILSHPSIASGLSFTRSLESSYPAISKTLESKSGQMAYRLKDNQDVLMKFSTLSNGWKVLLIAYKNEIYHYNNLTNLGLSMLFFSSIAGVIGLSLLLGNWISLPLTRLSASIVERQFNSSAYSAKLLRRKDEFGVLSRLLQDSIEQNEKNQLALQNYNDNLELMVEARSESLLQANSSLSKQRALIHSRQMDLKLQNERLEKSIQTLVSSEQQLIEEEKNATFREIVSNIAKEIKLPLDQALDQIKLQEKMIWQLTRKMLVSDYNRNSFIETYAFLQKNNRRLLGNLIFSKDIIDYIKDIGSDVQYKQIAIIELRDYLLKAREIADQFPKEMPVKILISEFEPTYLKLDPGKFLHIISSLLIQMLTAVKDSNHSLALQVLCSFENSNLEIKILDAFVSPDKSTVVQRNVNDETDTISMGVSMIGLLMKETFCGELTLGSSQIGRRQYTLYFPDVIIVDESVEL